MNAQEFLLARYQEIVETLEDDPIDRSIRSMLQTQAALLEMFWNNGVAVSKPMDVLVESVSGLGAVIKVSQPTSFMSRFAYVNQFKTEPPIPPVIKTMLAAFTDHPDFNQEWIA